MTTIYTTQLPSSSDLLTTYDITTGRGFFVFPLLPSFPFLPFIFVRSFVRSVSQLVNPSPSPSLFTHTTWQGSVTKRSEECIEKKEKKGELTGIDPKPTRKKCLRAGPLCRGRLRHTVGGITGFVSISLMSPANNKEGGRGVRLVYFFSCQPAHVK